MKVHTQHLETSNINTVENSSCCGPTTTTDQVNSDPCCEQPSDGTSCCDKTASKEENSKDTGCC